MTDSNEAFPAQPYLIAISSLVGGFLVSKTFEVSMPDLQSSAEWSSFGGSIASVGATLLGFMLAALAILASINNTHLLEQMRKSGHYRELLHTLFLGSLLMLACAVGGFVVMFGHTPTPIVFYALIALHFAVLMLVFDIGHKFWLVLSSLNS